MHFWQSIDIWQVMIVHGNYYQYQFSIYYLIPTVKIINTILKANQNEIFSLIHVNLYFKPLRKIFLRLLLLRKGKSPLII